MSVVNLWTAHSFETNPSKNVMGQKSLIFWFPIPIDVWTTHSDTLYHVEAIHFLYVHEIMKSMKVFRSAKKKSKTS